MGRRQWVWRRGGGGWGMRGDRGEGVLWEEGDDLRCLFISCAGVGR